MNDLIYRVPHQGIILSHFLSRRRTTFVRDGYHDAGTTDDAYELTIKARIRSGDYFATVATELDKLMQAVSSVDERQAAELDRIVNELLYVHSRYRIVRK